MFTFFFIRHTVFAYRQKKKTSYKSITKKKRSVKRGVKQKNTIKNQRWKITVQCKWL